MFSGYGRGKPIRGCSGTCLLTEQGRVARKSLRDFSLIQGKSITSFTIPLSKTSHMSLISLKGGLKNGASRVPEEKYGTGFGEHSTISTRAFKTLPCPSSSTSQTSFPPSSQWTSPCHPLHIGVPQVTISSPLFFLHNYP